VNIILELEGIEELIIVESGSTDGTKELSKTLSDEYDKVKSVSLSRGGKGAALDKGITVSNQEFVVLLDADFSMQVDEIKKLVKPLEDGRELVIASRYLEESNKERKLSRLVLSKTYNFTISRLLKTRVKDHQCGYKAVRKSSYESLNIQSDSWFWDTELIYNARKNNFSIEEVPINWTYKDNSEIGYFSTSTSLLASLIDLVRKENLRVYKFAKFGFIGALGAILNTAVIFSLVEFFNFNYLAASPIAIESAIVLMFILNNRYTFSNQKRGVKQIFEGLIKSNIYRSIGIMVQIAFLYFLTDVLEIYYILSNLASIGIASIFNFFTEEKLNWSEDYSS